MNLGEVAVAILGGGFKCAFEVRVLKKLAENFKISLYQGFSGGALNVARHAIGGLEEIWLEIQENGPKAVFGTWLEAGWHAARGDSAVYSDAKLNALLNKYLTDKDLDKLIDFPIPVEIVVWNETMKQLEVVVNHQFRGKSQKEKSLLRQFIKASSCFPGLLPPEEINGQVYSDPCLCVLDSFKNCDTLFIIDPSQPEVALTSDVLLHMKSYRRAANRYNDMADDYAAERLEKFAIENDFNLFPPTELESKPSVSDWVMRGLRKLAGKPAKKRIVQIKPTTKIATLSMEHFSVKDKDIDKSLAHGEKCVMEMIEKLKD